MAYSHNAPFHADVVGSYLRPSELKVARMDFVAGTISAAELKAVEDSLITELVDKQKAAGLHVITDSEFRRGWWHFDFMWGFNGVDHAAAATCSSTTARGPAYATGACVNVLAGVTRMPCVCNRRISTSSTP